MLSLQNKKQELASVMEKGWFVLCPKRFKRPSNTDWRKSQREELGRMWTSLSSLARYRDVGRCWGTGSSSNLLHWTLIQCCVIKDQEEVISGTRMEERLQNDHVSPCLKVFPADKGHEVIALAWVLQERNVDALYLQKGSQTEPGANRS